MSDDMMSDDPLACQRGLSNVRTHELLLLSLPLTLSPIGRWLDHHGEAIYGTRYWPVAQRDALDVKSIYYTWKPSATRARQTNAPDKDKTPAAADAAAEAQNTKRFVPGDVLFAFFWGRYTTIRANVSSY